MKKGKTFRILLLWGYFLLLIPGLSAQSYQLVSTAPPSIQSKANDVQLRFLPNNQIEYYVTEGQWRGWSMAFEWGAPQITYQPDGQLLAISTRGWIINAGPPQRGATIGVVFRGLTDGGRMLSQGQAYAGFSPGENRYVNGSATAQIKMTRLDEPEITATVYLADGSGTAVTLAAYTFRRTDFSTGPVITLNPPEISHNIQRSGEYWMSVKPTGWLSGYQGRTVQLVTRFYYRNETPLYAAPQEGEYRDVDGLVATATPPISITGPTLNLNEQIMYIPYRSLNLPSTGGQASYDLFLFVDVFVDGQLQRQSERVEFVVRW